MSLLSRIGSAFATIARSLAVKVIFTEKMKTKAVTELNKKVDLPILDETSEDTLYRKIWDAVESIVREEFNL